MIINNVHYISKYLVLFQNIYILGVLFNLLDHMSNLYLSRPSMGPL